jgi:hypothetical protein
MAETLIHQQEAPKWVKDIFKEIDTLQFGTGFSHLTEQTVMEFGTATVKGVQAIKQFFIRIDSPLEIEHRIHDFWDGGAIQILRGDAVLRKKGSNDEPTTTPLMQIFYMDADKSDELSRWFIVNGPIKTDSVI